MSRLLIKNIPVNASSDSLRTHLSSVKDLSAVITDVHVARKADGTPRRFAFVGFKTEEQAAAIKNYFDKTFWGSQKIVVEIVQVWCFIFLCLQRRPYDILKGVKDAPAPRPNKRPRIQQLDNASHVVSPSKEKQMTLAKSTKEDSNMDKLSEEFMSVMKSRKQRPAWADGPVPDPQVLQPQQEEKDGHPADETISDLDWLKSRMRHDIPETQSKAFEQSDDEDEPKDIEAKGDKGYAATAVSDVSIDPEDNTRQTILSTRRLFVRNLTFSCTNEELTQLFGKYGAIEQVS